MCIFLSIPAKHAYYAYFPVYSAFTIHQKLGQGDRIFLSNMKKKRGEVFAVESYLFCDGGVVAVQLLPCTLIYVSFF